MPSGGPAPIRGGDVEREAGTVNVTETARQGESRMNDREKPGEKRIHRSGFVAVAGLPNAGKSTLVNRFLREKLSIVSPKPQTTRSNVTCILSAEDYQIVFVDTPGLLTPRYRLQEVMASFAANAVADADIVLVLIDSSRCEGSFHHRLKSFAEELGSKKAVIALNKIDLVKKPSLLGLIARTSELFPGAEIVPVCAADGDGVDELFSVILGALPEGPAYFPEDMISTESERFFAAELIREAVFLAMEEEIPYASAVVIEQYEENPDLTVIGASILVEKDSQKPIIIGKSGATIKAIGTKARLGIEAFLGGKVFLDLNVKVRKDWREKDSYLREIGMLREGGPGRFPVRGERRAGAGDKR
jgi:GTPase